jgi:D-tyrosyl-tRNA(Tyr) deacylase
VQRVREARVAVDGEVIGEIGPGLCVLLGVAAADTESDADALYRKIAGLRVFADADGRFAHAVDEVGGALLVVSQFTLHADTSRGRRPSFTGAAPADRAHALYDHFVARARTGPVPVATGRFQAHMALALVNDGPVTLVLDTAPSGTVSERAESEPA